MRPVLFAVLVVATSLIARAGVEQMILAHFAVKDQFAACRAAEDYCYRLLPAKLKEGKPYRARSLALTRVPRNVGGNNLKAGEVVWIILVDNFADADFVPTPRALLFVRAEDGVVFDSSVDAKTG